ncbi:MAG: type II toxin-antitoxin system death-on-curing family toxin [Chloroflexi bacterium]|nr:type II toxin-antitoxin system death-on-curing family toxin [Chloroflexota bacterium]
MFYEDYPNPMPAFTFSGGEAHGRALLESALAEPRQTFGGRYLRRTIYDKAAALFRSLVKNHALFDGNKRLALACLFVFLMYNRVAFYVPRHEAIRFSLHVAREETTIREIASWIRRYALPITRPPIRRPPTWSTSKLLQAAELLREATTRTWSAIRAIKRRTKSLRTETGV